MIIRAAFKVIECLDEILLYNKTSIITYSKQLCFALHSSFRVDTRLSCAAFQIQCLLFVSLFYFQQHFLIQICHQAPPHLSVKRLKYQSFFQNLVEHHLLFVINKLINHIDSFMSEICSFFEIKKCLFLSCTIPSLHSKAA